ncbi:4Fe-4S binding protein [candidate division KSB1 bacterium]|nr:4Fe-4S binding protein [candidate division KSB1 bacterium]RQW02356.1 MAG: 4Fe-4S binding protein [candidate division KSB1 bacterium]
MERHIRRLTQLGFALVTIGIGIQFYLFVQQLERGGAVTVTRPPGVEAFLPISSLMSLKYWLVSGDFNLIHPAGLLIFLFILATALILKRGFCSWVCPFGLLSEALARVHSRLFDKPRRVWRWLDWPLRSLKYILLGFFVVAILGMSAEALRDFLYGPYNRVADIKMLYFFTDASALTIKAIAGLILLSVLVRHFWCRYLCPYGALLGLTSLASFFKIRRNTTTCTDCKKCSRVCPANISVHRQKTVHSDECHACLQCVAACPVPDTLSFSAPLRKLPLKPLTVALLIIGLFLIGDGLARLGGVWQNSISINEYRHHLERIDDPAYQHAR